MRETPSRPGIDKNASTAPEHARESLDRIITDLVTNGSIEMSTRPDGALPSGLNLLPFGMAVYVPKVLKRPLAENLEAIHALHAAGYDPVPHIAARQVESMAALEGFLERAVQESGVHRVMLIGGDEPRGQGPFGDSAGLLKSGILATCGIHEIDVAGYPEGHPRVAAEALAADLDLKLELAGQQGLGLSVITQFSFVPSRIIEYCDELAHQAPQVPVYVGMAGPTDAVSLLRFARHCGVSEAIRALSSLGVKAAKLATHTDPDEQIEVLARYCAGHESSNLIGVHVFSFGGFARSAQWMRDKFPHLHRK